MIEDKCFVARDGWCSRLTMNFSADAPVAHIRHSLNLKADEYTIISMRDKMYKDFFRVCGPHYEVERLDKHDDAKSFDACDTVLQFEWTLEGVEAISHKIKEEPEEECPEELYSGTVKVGNNDLIVKDGLIVDCKIARNRYVKDGTYMNAAVCMEDGCITDIAEGHSLRNGSNCLTGHCDD